MKVTKQTMYNWWRAFCKESGLILTPLQALEIHKDQFFDWLRVGPHMPGLALATYPTRPLRDAAFEALGALVRQAEAEAAAYDDDDDA